MRRETLKFSFALEEAVLVEENSRLCFSVPWDFTRLSPEDRFLSYVKMNLRYRFSLWLRGNLSRKAGLR